MGLAAGETTQAAAARTLSYPVAILVGMADHDAYAPVDTPMGPVFVAWNDHGVCRVEPGADAARFEAGFEALFGRPVSRSEGPPPGVAADPDVAIDWRGVPDFDRTVLVAIRAIPAGDAWTYGEVAEAIGKPGAARAVGGALGRNRVPVIVPCHRVVAAGGLGGFGLGLEAKRALLAAEGYPAVEQGRLLP
jgi:methylated-DNA-[protein]-cysteine S-methyltransferase